MATTLVSARVAGAEAEKTTRLCSRDIEDTQCTRRLRQVHESELAVEAHSGLPKQRETQAGRPEDA